MIVIVAAAALMGLARLALSLPPEYNFLVIFIAIAIGVNVLGGAVELALARRFSRSAMPAKDAVSMKGREPELKPSPTSEAEKT
jgi:hypothetical protein